MAVGIRLGGSSAWICARLTVVVCLLGLEEECGQAPFAVTDLGGAVLQSV